jgi:hypothetical protein
MSKILSRRILLALAGSALLARNAHAEKNYDALACQLQEATGLQVRHVDVGPIGYRGAFVFVIPANVDKKNYLNHFIQARNAAGVSKEQMGITEGDYSYLGIKAVDMKGDFYVDAQKVFLGQTDIVPKLKNEQRRFLNLIGQKSNAAACPKLTS